MEKLPWPAVIYYPANRVLPGAETRPRADQRQGQHGQGGSETCKEESPCAQDEHPATAFGETHPMQILVTEW